MLFLGGHDEAIRASLRASLDRLIILKRLIYEGDFPMAESQADFDILLSTYLSADTAYQAAVNNYIAAVAAKAPTVDLSAEAAEVTAAQTALAAASTALSGATP
jgi:hypothetical protein